MTLRIVITPGEPAGIGPELCAQLAQQAGSGVLQDVELVAIADPALLEQRANRLQLPLALQPCQLTEPPVATRPGTLGILPLQSGGQHDCGRPDVHNAPYLLQSLDQAVALCRNGQADAMVTGPLNKASINEAGIAFSGHTEYLAERCGVKRTVMMLATEGLRVALATTHLPLREVPDAISPDSLEQTIDILHAALLKDFGITTPRIAVCGLNPHAGESGHLGHEELDIIIPLLEKKREQGMLLNGPLPADTLFTPRVLDVSDAVLAMYHDQGLPVLKYKGFGKAVNITLGLPIIRTSVDHGTALDIAGQGIADPGSLLYAIETASMMARQQSTAQGAA